MESTPTAGSTTITAPTSQSQPIRRSRLIRRGQRTWLSSPKKRGSVVALRRNITTPQMSVELLGRRLRAERERRRITLESIAANTKISIGLLRALERDDVARWPTGIFRRSFVRAYAAAIGLDADEVLHEFLEAHPEPLDESPGAPPVAVDAPRRLRQPAHLRLTLDDS